MQKEGNLKQCYQYMMLSVLSCRTCFLSLPFSSWAIIFQLLRRHIFLSVIFDAALLGHRKNMKVGRKNTHVPRRYSLRVLST